MTESGTSDTQLREKDVVLIVGGGPGISSSCARSFAKNGMLVGVAARNPDKSALENLEKTARCTSIRMRCKQARGRGVAV